MAESNFTVRVDEELKQAFARAARAHERTGAQLVREFMKDYVARSEAERAHDVWFRRQVAIGQADVAAGRVLPDDEVEAHFAARRQPFER